MSSWLPRPSESWLQTDNIPLSNICFRPLIELFTYASRRQASELIGHVTILGAATAAAAVLPISSFHRASSVRACVRAGGRAGVSRVAGMHHISRCGIARCLLDVTTLSVSIATLRSWWRLSPLSLSTYLHVHIQKPYRPKDEQQNLYRRDAWNDWNKSRAYPITAAASAAASASRCIQSPLGCLMPNSLRASHKTISYIGQAASLRFVNKTVCCWLFWNVLYIYLLTYLLTYLPTYLKYTCP